MTRMITDDFGGNFSTHDTEGPNRQAQTGPPELDRNSEYDIKSPQSGVLPSWFTEAVRASIGGNMGLNFREASAKRVYSFSNMGR